MAYIDRDIFINNELIPLVKRLDLCHPKQKKGVLMAIQKLNEEPTADVVEVKHGKWVVTSEEDGACYVKCSECGLETWYPIPDKSMLHNYCGDCGAKMDLEEE